MHLGGQAAFTTNSQEDRASQEKVCLHALFHEIQTAESKTEEIAGFFAHDLLAEGPRLFALYCCHKTVTLP